MLLCAELATLSELLGDYLMESNEKIGTRIQRLRYESKETQEELAKALGVKRQTVDQWENEKRDLKTHYTVSLANHFGVSCDYLLRGIEADNLSVNEKTGLQNEAISKLAELKSLADENNLEDIIKSALERRKDTDLLSENEEKIYISFTPEEEHARYDYEWAKSSLTAISNILSSTEGLNLINDIDEYVTSSYSDHPVSVHIRGNLSGISTPIVLAQVAVEAMQRYRKARGGDEPE